MGLPLTRAALDRAVPTMALGPVAVADGDTSLARVLSLPRREPASPELIAALSASLRARPFNDAGEPNVLRPAQAEVLREAYEYGGVFAPMQVGAGKSLPTLLLPTLLRSSRPVLMVPASLREKTRRDFARYRKDWFVRLPTIVSYESMSRVDRDTYLSGGPSSLNPDLLMLDEAHHVRNDSARTRKVARCIEACKPVVVCLSGTLITENLLDYHHQAVWCLNERAPVPTRRTDAERWASALDRDLGPLKRQPMGALEYIPGGYHEWFRSSRGVVPTSGSDCTASIQLSIWKPELPEALKQIIEGVSISSLRPDGELLDEWELPDCQSQLALGFYYVWNPLPPDWWLAPRRAWRQFVRDILDARLEGFDSEAQIVNALDRGPELGIHVVSDRPEVPGAEEGLRLLTEWRNVRDQFEPNTVPVWIDDGVLREAAAVAKREPTLVWVRYRAAGQKLHELGLPYYGGGQDPEGARGSIALSIAAHGTGRNMQAWCRSLVLTPMANADAWEQLIGRTHRSNQRSDTVYVQVIGTIDYHSVTLGRVLSQAHAIAHASGFDHKLTIADWV